MTPMNQSNTLENMSFEQALAELETIVKDLESGKAPLEESMKYYERGTLLKEHCAKKLAEAQSKIDKIAVGKDGKASTEPFNTDE